jgi:hypothetical protein
MSLCSLKLSDDLMSVTLARSNEFASLSAGDVDRLIEELIRHRSQMLPVHSAEPDSTAATVYNGDNLLWSVKPSVAGQTIDLGIQHPGLGWIRISLARAQVEDLENSIEYALNFVGRSQEFRHRFEAAV